MTPGFRYRGPKTFYFRRKKRFYSLLSTMAYYRTCYPGGGGSWSGKKTGDGVAWHKDGDRFGPWMKKRKIVRGQWAGPWYRVNWRTEDV